MNVATVRAAMATALDTIPNVQVNAYVQAQPNPPGIQIIPPGCVYDYSMGATNQGLSNWTFVVQGFVALNTDIGAQKTLDLMCNPSGPSSVKAALEADLTLGGTVEKLRVTEHSPGRQVEQVPGNPLLLVEWRVLVYAKGA